MRRVLREHCARVTEASDLDALGRSIVVAAREVAGASGVSFSPLADGKPIGDGATYFHERFAPEHLRRETLVAFSATDREVGRIETLMAQHAPVVDLTTALGRSHERTKTYNEYWRPLAIERQVLLMLGDAREQHGFVCVTRSATERPFSETELERLRHVRDAALVALQRLSPRTSRGIVLAALEHLPYPCALFDARGVIVWCTASLAPMRRAATRLARWRAVARACLLANARVERDGLAAIPVGPTLILVSQERTAGRSGWTDALHRKLTEREAEILRNILEGRGNKDIALRLAVGTRTVEAHVSAILRKANCSSRAELLARLLR